MVLLVTVLNSDLTMRSANRRFWYSFISTTCAQYLATSFKFSCSHSQTRFRMSFWKQLPPNPIEAFRNLGPTRESRPTAYATSSMSAPVASHTALSALMLEMRCARMAFAAYHPCIFSVIQYKDNTI